MTHRPMQARRHPAAQRAGQMLAGAALLGSSMLTAPATADTLEELTAQIESLNRKVEELRTQSTAAPVIAPAQAVTAGDFPGAIKLPGTNTSFKVGGYVKLDYHYTTAQGIGDSFGFSSIAVPGSTSAAELSNGQSRLHARQTRFNIETRTPSDLGLVRTYIEGDFFGVGGTETLSNSSSFRLRHAYGTLGNFLAGQTWSTFMHLAALPNTLDFFGPTSSVFVRQGQVRYTLPLSGGFKAEFALENPQTIVFNAGPSGSLGGTGINDDRIPDFIAKLTYSGDWGFLSLAGLVGALDVNTGATPIGGAIIDDEEVLWGIHVGGRVNTWGKDSVSFTAIYTEGGNRYMLGAGLAAPLFDSGGFVDLGGNIETIDQWGGFVSYEHWWTDSLFSTAAYGYSEIDDVPTTIAGGAAFPAFMEKNQSVHVNLQWVPVPRVTLGVEYILGWAEFENLPAGAEDDNTAQRFQFAAKFDF